MSWSTVAVGGLLGIALHLFADIRTPAHDFGYAVGQWSRANNAVWLDFIVITLAGLFFAAVFVAVVVCVERAIRALVCR